MAKPVLQNLAKRVHKFFETSGSNGSTTPPGTPENPSPKIAINKVYYLHMRMYDECDNLLPWGGSTIAYQVTREDGNDEVTDPGSYLYFVDIGIANCRASDKGRDLFCKRIGRDIALARLLDDNRVVDAGMVGHHPTHAEVIALVRESFYQEREEFVPQIRLMVR